MMAVSVRALLPLIIGAVIAMVRAPEGLDQGAWYFPEDQGCGRDELLRYRGQGFWPKDHRDLGDR